MFQAYVDSITDETTNVFYSRDEALAWLAAPASLPREFGTDS
jgi:hypothetical protein